MGVSAIGTFFHCCAELLSVSVNSSFALLTSRTSVMEMLENMTNGENEK